MSLLNNLYAFSSPLIVQGNIRQGYHRQERRGGYVGLFPHSVRSGVSVTIHDPACGWAPRGLIPGRTLPFPLHR